MLFTSIDFVILYLLTFVAFYLLRDGRAQIFLLISVSFVFYAWNMPILLTLLIFSILTNAIVSFRVAVSNSAGKSRAWAIGGVIVNLSLLGLFKYDVLVLNLVREIVGTYLLAPKAELAFVGLPLPIGISFYTFEGISLVVDVFRGRTQYSQPPATSFTLTSHRFSSHLRNTALFVAFFPHLIAGPVLKAAAFFPQIGRHYFANVRWDVVASNLLTGYFLKMVVADNLHNYTSWISYPYYQVNGTLTNSVLIVGYACQIFSDFAGYSMIAIGLAEGFGYKLMTNFNFPYISRSLSEFWRRWHISLSSWLRNYLYIPLGGNQRGHVRTYFNLLIVMALGGLWHGAAWSYAVWGVFHGVGLVVERLATQVSKRFIPNRPALGTIPRFLLSAVQMGTVFVFVMIGWVFFILPNFAQATAFLFNFVAGQNIRPNWMVILPVVLFSMPVACYHLRYLVMERGGRFATEWRRWCDGTVYGIMLFALLLNAGSSQAFIYFQF